MIQQETVESDDHINSLERLVNQILNEFWYLETALAKIGEYNSLLWHFSKILLILLGALVAAREVTTQLFGANNGVSIVVFTIIGLAISVIAGLDATFKWDKSATDLKSLAATCQVNKLNGITELQKALVAATDEEKLVALEKLLDSLKSELQEVYLKSTTMGINIVREANVIKKKMKAQNSTGISI